MKQTHICGKCRERGIGFLDFLRDAIPDEADESYRAVGSMPYKPVAQVKVEGSGRHTREVYGVAAGATDSRLKTLGRTQEAKAGSVEGYLCTRCGYLERYVQDPGWMPFAKLKGFRWVNAIAKEQG